MNGQAAQAKKRRPLDDLSVSVAGDSKKNRPGSDATSDDSLPLPPCEAVEAICEGAGRAQENQQPASAATAIVASLASQLPPLPSVSPSMAAPLVNAILPSLTQSLPSLSPLPTPPAAHQQVAQTLPDDVVIPSPPARRRSLLMWNPRLRGDFQNGFSKVFAADRDYMKMFL